MAKKLNSSEQRSLVSASRDREYWIDLIKLFACILVALGHFLQSMTTSGIAQPSKAYGQFYMTIYTFHVQLFFLCSGYLYQRFTRISSFGGWCNHIVQKLITLGVPYLVFSLLTWLLKTFFSDTVNTQAGDLLTVLFVKPLSPYWYLYALFFMFLITPVFRRWPSALIGLAVAFLMRLLSVPFQSDIQAVDYLLTHELWFVLGMVLCVVDVPHRIPKIWLLISGTVLCSVFLVVQLADLPLQIPSYVKTAMACLGFSFLAMAIPRTPHFIVAVSKYTLPIYLMHTLFSAPVRILLLKIGIENRAVHFILGLTATFVGPVIAAFIMGKVKWLNFLLYPGKYWKPRIMKEIRKEC